MNTNHTKVLAKKNVHKISEHTSSVPHKFIFQVRVATVLYRPVLTIGCRNYTTQVPAQTAGEVRITEILRQKFAGATYIKVEDISGMYRREWSVFMFATCYTNRVNVTTKNC